MFIVHAVMFFVCLFSAAWSASATQDREFELRVYSEERVLPVLPLLQDWVEEAFLGYPYLWVAPKEREIYPPNAHLADEKNAIIVVVQCQGKIVGIASGNPLDSPVLEPVLQPMLKQIAKQGFDPSQMFYMPYFLTSSEYRNDAALVEMMYQYYVDFARSIGKSQICYFQDRGMPVHPLRPEPFVEIEPWHLIQGFRSMNVQMDLAWPTLQPDGSVRDQMHTMEFFVQDLNESL